MKLKRLVDVYNYFKFELEVAEFSTNPNNETKMEYSKKLNEINTRVTKVKYPYLKNGSSLIYVDS